MALEDHGLIVVKKCQTKSVHMMPCLHDLMIFHPALQRLNRRAVQASLPPEKRLLSGTD
jgi:hypothetical protein